MNAWALFAYGLFVTMIVGVAIGLLIWGAILDGRYEEKMKEKRRADASERTASPVAPAAARD